MIIVHNIGRSIFFIQVMNFIRRRDLACRSSLVVMLLNQDTRWAYKTNIKQYNIHSYFMLLSNATSK